MEPTKKQRCSEVWGISFSLINKCSNCINNTVCKILALPIKQKIYTGNAFGLLINTHHFLLLPVDFIV